MASEKERIVNALRTEALAGPFWPVSHDGDTKVVTVDDLTVVVPAQILAQEMSTSFGAPQRNRRRDRLERQSWRWKVDCAFNEEVSTEPFEKRLIENPVILSRDPDNGFEQQVTLKLRSADPFHPPQQSPSTGTKVTFEFEAELSPV